MNHRYFTADDARALIGLRGQARCAQRDAFVVIDPYQFEGDVALGVWVEHYQKYVLGDGDCYNVEELARCWPHAKLLTWSELEAMRLAGY